MAGSNSLAPFESPANAPAAALQEALREAAEKGLAESRAAYARARDAADQVASAFETSLAQAAKGVIDLNSKALDALRANFDAGVDFAKAAINSKSVGEFAALHSDYASNQAEAFATQAREFADLAQKIAAQTLAPIKREIGGMFRVSA